MGFFNLFKPKHIFNENGENIIMFDQQNQGIKCKFTKKNGVINGPLIIYYEKNETIPFLTSNVDYLIQQHFKLKANFNNGLIHGLVEEFPSSNHQSITKEVYDNGQITNQKKFYVEPGDITLSKLKLTNEKKFLPNEIGQGLLIKRIESLLEKYNI